MSREDKIRLIDILAQSRFTQLIILGNQLERNMGENTGKDQDTIQEILQTLDELHKGEPIKRIQQALFATAIFIHCAEAENKK